MAWPLVIAAVGSAVGAGITSAGQTRAAKKRQQAEIKNRIEAINAAEKARKAAVSSVLGGSFLGQFGTEDVFGTRPTVIPPVDVGQVVSENVGQLRRQGVPSAIEFAGDISRDVLQRNLERARTLQPNFDILTGQIGAVTEDLLFGRLPFEDVLDIVSERQSLSAALGTPGGAAPATLKDLGLSRLGAMQQGFNMFTSFQDTLARSVSPISRFEETLGVLPFTSLTANQRVSGELLAQIQAQNAEIIRASADPAAAQLFQQEFLATQTAAGIRAGTGNTIFGSAGTTALGTGITAGSQAFARQQQLNQQQQQTPVGAGPGAQGFTFS